MFRVVENQLSKSKKNRIKSMGTAMYKNKKKNKRKEMRASARNKAWKALGS